MYRDDQQNLANKGLTKFQKLLRRVEEKTRDNMRKKLEKREREEEKIRLNELNRAAPAANEERETKTTMDDSIGKHKKREAVMKDEAAAQREAGGKRRDDSRERRKELQERSTRGFLNKFEMEWFNGTKRFVESGKRRKSCCLMKKATR